MVYNNFRNIKKINANLDFNAQANIINKCLIKLLRLTPIFKPLFIFKGVYGNTIKYYGVYYIFFSIINSRKITRLLI